jgi:hypothetical protein
MPSQCELCGSFVATEETQTASNGMVSCRDERLCENRRLAYYEQQYQKQLTHGRPMSQSSIQVILNKAREEN